MSKGCREIYAIDPVGYMLNSPIHKLVRIDFERESFCPPCKFDLIIFTEFIEHLKFHPLPTLIKLKKLLSRGGRVLLTTPVAKEWGRLTDFYPCIDAIPEYDGQKSEWIDGHIWQYTKNEHEYIFFIGWF